MSPRPYFSKSIEEIGQVYKKNQDSPRVLSDLLGELKYRKTRSAAELRREIERKLKSSRHNAQPKQSGESLDLFAQTLSNDAGEGQLSERSARAILGVSGDASFPEIKAAWLKARGSVKSRVSETSSRSELKRINEAFQFLERSTGGEF